MDSFPSSLRLALLPVLVAWIAPASSAQFVLGDHSGFGILGMDDAEITPDGRYAVVRHNNSDLESLVFDLSTGQLVASLDCSQPGPFVQNAGAQDAVAVTNDRAVVVSHCTTILDLSNPVQAITSFATGPDSRDLAITPDERIVAIRGGRGGPGMADPGGLFLVDLQTGALLANTAGLPANPQFSFDVDSVVVSNDYAAFVSLENTGSGPRTRVTIFDLSTFPGSLPTIVFETTSTGSDQDQLGNPHDIAITPDGLYLAVRSGQSVGLYELNGAQTQRLWHKRLIGDPGPFGNSAMDSIEVTNDWIVTISRDSNGVFGAQVDLFDIQGTQRFDDISGDPHDLEIMPGGEQFLVRTSSGLFLYDLTNVPAGLNLPFVDSQPLSTSHTTFAAGLDSLVVVEGGAATLSRDTDSTQVEIWDVGSASLTRRSGGVMADKPVDLQASPNGRLLGVSGLHGAQVYDMLTGDLLLDHAPVAGSDIWPWCDGIAMNDSSLVAFGYFGPQAGWVSIIDLFSDQTPYCAVSPNSVGDGATIYATGSPSVASNDVELIVRDLPANKPIQFVYGAGQIDVPFGDGRLCIGGQAFRFPFQRSSADGVARQVVDNTGALRVGGAIMVGTTWNFQLIYRDPAGPGGAGVNTSDGIQIPFGL